MGCVSSSLMDKQIVYNSGVIESFASAETGRLFASGKSRRLPPEILRRAVMRLTQLEAATASAAMRKTLKSWITTED